MATAEGDQGTEFLFQTQDNADWSLHWMCLYIFLLLTWGVLVHVVRVLLTQRILPIEYLAMSRHQVENKTSERNNSKASSRTFKSNHARDSARSVLLGRTNGRRTPTMVITWTNRRRRPTRRTRASHLSPELSHRATNRNRVSQPVFQHGTQPSRERAFMLSENSQNSSELTAMDSAATSHMFKSRSGFTNFKSCFTSITLAGEGLIWAHGRGDCYRQVLLPDGSTSLFTFKDVLWVPELQNDLISTSKLIEDGYSQVFNEGLCEVLDSDKNVVMYALLGDKLYHLQKPGEKCSSCLEGIDLLHRRFGHASPPYVHQWMKKGERKKLSFCDACASSKSHRQPFKHEIKDRPNVRRPLDMVVSDLCGPFRVASSAGSRYFMTIVDVFSRFLFVAFLKTRDEVAEKLKAWLIFVKKQLGYPPKCFQSDGAAEYSSKEVKDMWAKEGTKQIVTAAYSSNQNAIAERINRTLLESGRSMMFQAGAYLSLWEEAYKYAALVKNLLPHSSIDFSSPISKFPLVWLQDANIHKRIRVWGCRVWVHDAGCKLSAVAKPGLFVGVDLIKKGYRVILDHATTPVVRRDVVFDESSYPLKNTAISSPSQPYLSLEINNGGVNDNGISTNEQQVEEKEKEVYKAASARREREPSGAALRNIVGGDSVYHTQEQGEWNDMPALIDSDSDSDYDSDSSLDLCIGETEEKCFQAGERKKFKKFPKKKLHKNPDVPNSWKQATTKPDSEKWIKAAKTEYSQLEEHGTWTTVSEKEPAMVEQQILGNRWVFDRKMNEVTNTVMEKARLVVQGFMQIPGIDYEEVYSAVAMLKSFRILMAISASLGFVVTKLDFKNAYVQAPLKKTVYMRHPDGFPGPPGTCLKLIKSLYGLVEASKLWADLLKSFLLTLGFIVCRSDACVYFHPGFIMFLIIYSDDVLCHTSNEKARKIITKKIAERFKIKILGVVKKYVGIEVAFNDNGSIAISQSNYVLAMLERYKMSSCNPSKTPASPGQMELPSSSTDTQDEEERAKIPYRSAVGSLLYAARGARPELELSVNLASQFNYCYTQTHWQWAKRIFRYLKIRFTHCQWVCV